MNFFKKILDFFGVSGKEETGGCSESCSSCSHEINKSDKKIKIDIFSPCDGVIVDQKDIPDEGFSEGHMGQGLGIDPSGSEVCSFMSGKLVVLFKTKHAYVIQEEESGVSVMLHLGVNTVTIPEEHKAFSTDRKVDDVVKAKESLCSMNLDVIEKEAKSKISALLVQNDNMENKKIIYHIKSGEVKKGDLLMSVVSV